MRALAARINPSYPAAAQADLSSALSSLAALPELHALAHSQITTLPEIGHYSSVIATLLAFDNDIAAGSPSAPLAQTVTSIEALAQVEEETSQQRAVLYAALIEGQFEPGALTALIGAQSSQASDAVLLPGGGRQPARLHPQAPGCPPGSARHSSSTTSLRGPMSTPRWRSSLTPPWPPRTASR